MRRAAFIWLPRWPTDRLRRRACAAPPDRPFALLAQGAGGVRLAAVDANASALGLAPGQLLADARALVPALVCRDHDPIADAAALARLARWCVRFGPFVAPAAGRSGADGLFLDLDGVPPLFGGEAGWLEAALAALRRLGFEARAAIADTPGAAWALAHHAPQAATIAPPGAGLAALAPLPAAALRLPPETVEALRAVGLKRVGDLLRAPRASLARRFGRALVEALDAAEGVRPDPIDALAPAPQFFVDLRFAEPVTALLGLEVAVDRLAAKLCARLDRAGRGARRFVLTLKRVDGEAAEIRLGAARALSAPAALARLAKKRFEALAERLDLGFGVEAMRCAAFETERVVAQAVRLDADPAADAAAAASDLGDRLAARLGEAAVRRLAPHASHLPERAERLVCREAPPEPFPPRADRPILLLHPPEPVEAMAEVPDGPPRRFRWRRVMHQVLRAEGPERVAAEWWRANAPTRDYYRVETAEGRRFQLCREGLYGREEAAPRWFVSGCFA